MSKENKENKVLQVANFLNENPNATGTQVAKKFKVALSYAYVLMSKARRRAIKKEADDVVEEVHTSDEDLSNFVYNITLGRGTLDNINHPPHYKVGGIETIDFIEAKGLDYHLGNVVKYISRANHKGNKLDDLNKARWYLNRAIDNLGK
jgi:hypothetical protein